LPARIIQLLAFLAFISFSADSFGHTNNHISLINNNLKHFNYIITTYYDSLEIDKSNFKELSSDSISSYTILVQHQKKNTSSLLIHRNDSPSQVLFYADQISYLKAIDFDKDEKAEFLLERSFCSSDTNFQTLLIIRVDSLGIDSLIYVTAFSIIPTQAKVSDLVEKRYFYKIKDYNKDGLLDIRVKTTRKYFKERNCDCDKSHYYKVGKKTYYFREGEFWNHTN
jgi:hypothetical protein